ncbi:MAG: hypothetical protein M5U26_26300 [Planctomycetota bacterium]|nr:hypothetical protein [Planctomycetota bacterium]
MAGRWAYEVRVGKNVASLKKAPSYDPRQDAPLYRLQEADEGRAEGLTDRVPFEVSFVYLLLGGVLCTAAYLLYRAESMSELARYGGGAVLGLAGLGVVLKGILTIGDRRRMLVESGRIVTSRTVFWIPFKKEIHCKPEHVVCAGHTKKNDPRCWRLDACVVLPRPFGGIPFVRLEGYAEISTDEAARLKTYEVALLEIHEEARKLAEALDVPLKPHFGPGPIPEELAELFGEEAMQAAKAEAAAEEAEAQDAEEPEDEPEARPARAKPRPGATARSGPGGSKTRQPPAGSSPRTKAIGSNSRSKAVGSKTHEKAVRPKRKPGGKA